MDKRIHKNITISDRYYKEFKGIERLKKKFLAVFRGKGVKNKFKALMLLLLSLLNTIAIKLKLKELSKRLQLLTIKTEFYFYGYSIICKNINHFHYVFSPWEEHEYKIIRKFLDGGVAIDGGAYIGTHSLIMSKNAKKVYSIEANKRNSEILRENIKLNNIKNIIVIDKALSKEIGNVRFSSNEEGDGTGRVSKRGIMVESINIDSLIKKEKVGLIKLDIEGQEFNALKGAENTLKKSHPVIIFEALSEDKLYEIIDFLKKFGYENYYRLNQYSYLVIKK